MLLFQRLWIFLRIKIIDVEEERWWCGDDGMILIMIIKKNNDAEDAMIFLLYNANL